MIIFSVDYGDARTGMAVCDKLEILASPVGVIHEDYQPKLIVKLADSIKASGAQLVVVGKPLNMDGTAGSRAQKCEQLAALLEQQLDGIEVCMWDERLTTVSAYRALDSAGAYGSKRKGAVDAASAVVILESYLSYKKNQKEKQV